MLHALRKHPDDRVREAATSTLAVDFVAARRSAWATHVGGARAVGLYRLVHDCGSEKSLPGIVRRREDERPANDEDVDRVYDACGTTYRFFDELFGRSSLDGRGMHLISSVHYGHRFDNAAWDGGQLLCGDGDGIVFRSFTACIDITAHELMHGMIQAEGGLEYAGESGALNESVADVFGLLVKQWSLGQPVVGADWTIGAGQFTGTVCGRGLRSLSQPGFAYDDPILGKDPQPSHMRHYVAPMMQNADVHINSGIPNHAFYLLAKQLGGHAWDITGRIWYDAVCSGLSARSGFTNFAEATLRAARPYGRTAVVETEHAWQSVGILQHATTGNVV
ncbi:MAG: M4 family metallopeptidase [Candidatus Eremiobacteraeota bacterium]|nr:M4 family metallopeptidase [Candidatus Eremiobacteraeota bacterium]